MDGHGAAAPLAGDRSGAAGRGDHRPRRRRRPRSRRCGSAPTTSSRSRSRRNGCSTWCGAPARSASWCSENRRLRRAVNEQSADARASSAPRGPPKLCARAVAELAGTDVSVILYGETGVGKDLVARCLHDFGRRAEGPLRRGQLRRDPRDHGRERVLRPRGRRVHQRRQGARRQARACERRHAVPRRDRQHAAGDAGQAAARAAGPGGRAARLEPQHRGRPAADRGEQDRPARARAPRGVSGSISITACRWSSSRCRRCASAARTSRCCSSISPPPRRKRYGRELRPVSAATLDWLMTP